MGVKILTSYPKREEIEDLLASEIEDAMRHTFSEGKVARASKERAERITDEILDILGAK